MTIKIQAFQRIGQPTVDMQDEYEFCCWQQLYSWLGQFNKLHACETHKCTDNNDCANIKGEDK